MNFDAFPMVNKGDPNIPIYRLSRVLVHLGSSYKILHERVDTPLDQLSNQLDLRTKRKNGVYTGDQIPMISMLLQWLTRERPTFLFKAVSRVLAQ